jgi:hypothetical protein
MRETAARFLARLLLCPIGGRERRAGSAPRQPPQQGEQP